MMFGMTVKDLIEQLQRVPGDTLVVLAKDEEGNGYSPLSTVDTENSAYVPDTDYSGEVHLQHLTPELIERGYGEDDVADADESVPCVCLWPM